MSAKSYIAVGLQILGYKDIIKEKSLGKCIKHIHFKETVIKHNAISKETMFFYFYHS